MCITKCRITHHKSTIRNRNPPTSWISLWLQSLRPHSALRSLGPAISTFWNTVTTVAHHQYLINGYRAQLQSHQLYHSSSSPVPATFAISIPTVTLDHNPHQSINNYRSPLLSHQFQQPPQHQYLHLPQPSSINQYRNALPYPSTVLPPPPLTSSITRSGGGGWSGPSSSSTTHS